MEASHSKLEEIKEGCLQGQVTYYLLIQPSSTLAIFRASLTIILLHLSPLVALKRSLSSPISYWSRWDTTLSCTD